MTHWWWACRTKNGAGPSPPSSTSAATLRSTSKPSRTMCEGSWQDTRRRKPYIRKIRSEEHTSELQSLMRTSYAVFCLKKQKTHTKNNRNQSKTQKSCTSSHNNHAQQSGE